MKMEPWLPIDYSIDYPIDYNMFLQSKKILHCDTSRNYEDGIRFFVQNDRYDDETKCDMISYNTIDHFGKNKDMSEHEYKQWIRTCTSSEHHEWINNNWYKYLELDAQGNYYYEHDIFNHKNDAIDNIHFETSPDMQVQFTYHIDDEIYYPEEINEFVFIAGRLSRYIIRITFLKPPCPTDKFTIYSRRYLMKHYYRKILATTPVITNTHIYIHCMCFRRNTSLTVEENIHHLYTESIHKLKLKWTLETLVKYFGSDGVKKLGMDT